jgi:multiple sugar transport system substrate-binding protein
MYYNKALISENEIPTTWDDFVNVCKAKTTSTVYGWAIPNMYSITKDIFYSMLLQNGGALLDSSTHVPTFASSQAISLLQKIYDWKYTDKISPSEVGAGGDSTLFKAGKSVFYFDGPWTINSFDALGTLDYGVAPMPGSTGEGTSYGDSHQVGFCKSTVTDNLTKSACYTFLNYLSSQGQTWAEAGQVPAKLSVQETTEYKSLSKLQAFTQETKTSQSGNLDYQYFYEAYNFMGSGVANALNNDKQPSVALSEQATKFTQFVKEEE